MPTEWPPRWPTILAKDAEAAIRAKTLTRSTLYEPDQAPKGTKFVFVDFGPALGRIPHRIRPPNKGASNA